MNNIVTIEDLTNHVVSDTLFSNTSKGKRLIFFFYPFSKIERYEVHQDYTNNNKEFNSLKLAIAYYNSL